MVLTDTAFVRIITVTPTADKVKIMTAQGKSKTLHLAGHERAKCPHCLALQPDEASAYVIPGTNGVKQDACELCGKRFSIAELATGQFRITPLHTPVKTLAHI